MRSCEETLDLISAALDGPLSDGDQAALDEHLSRCPACSALFEELRALRSAVSELEDVPAPAGFAGRVMDAIAAGPAQERPDSVIPFPAKKKRVPWKGWAATAAVVAVVALGAVVLPGRLGAGGSTASTADCAEPAAAPGGDAGASTGSSAFAETRGSAAMDAAESERESMPSAAPDGKLAEDAALPQELEGSGVDAEPQDEVAEAIIDADGDTFASSPAPVCGTLTLTGEPLPEGLEDYEYTEDEEGNRIYRVPADYFFSSVESLRARQAANFIYSPDQENTDPSADYGLIIEEVP